MRRQDRSSNRFIMQAVDVDSTEFALFNNLVFKKASIFGSKTSREILSSSLKFACKKAARDLGT